LLDISSKMKFNTPTTTVLYSIEETIKAYRRLSQHNISQIVPDITVDQALILLLLENNDKTQTEIADLVFKDYASMTRIVKLMMNKDYLIKKTDNQDKRKAKLEITEKGKIIIKKLKPIIQVNRETALSTISEEELEQLYKTLQKITKNCNS
jgi:DNA-binding MarR family transcriptional regulator